MKRKEYLGGEKLFPLSLLFKKARDDFFRVDGELFEGYKTHFTFGAHSSLLAILDDLQVQPDQFVLLPSFLCESVLMSFKQRAIQYQFYSVDSDLRPDFLDIDRKLNECAKAILFIDYMGSSHCETVRPHQSKYLQRNVSIIQDAVQSVVLDNKFLYGDYVINSFRKTTGVEGGILLSKSPMSIAYSKGVNFSFLFFKRMGQFFRYLHVSFPSVIPTWFLFYFRKAESFYYDSNIYKLPFLNKFLLSRIDFTALNEMHSAMDNLFKKKWGHFQPAHLNQNNFVPLGFFLILPERDTVLRALADESIFCPVHWRLPAEVSRKKFSGSWKLSEGALTIPFASPLTMSIKTMEERLNKIVNTATNPYL